MTMTIEIAAALRGMEQSVLGMMAVADAADEPLIAARLSHAATCIRERIEALNRPR